jgi:hypothetical protein
MHNDTSMIKHRFYETHLPCIKPVGDHGVSSKQALFRQPKRRDSTIFPPIAPSTSSGSSLINGPVAGSTTNTETLSSSTSPFNTAVHEAAKRFILRNNLAKFSQESSSVHVTHSSQPKRTTRYNHVQAKIDTGLPRPDSIHRPECDTHQLEPVRPMKWHVLKHEIEQDTQIRAYTKRIKFNSGVAYTTQLTTLGNTIQSKVKSHITSMSGGGEERYKIVVHLTVFPTTAAGLHVASRCLWNTHTDNSITIKMQGVDCNILIVVFLCYTDLGAL